MDAKTFEQIREAIRERGKRPAHVQIREMIDRGAINEKGEVMYRGPWIDDAPLADIPLHLDDWAAIRAAYPDIRARLTIGEYVRRPDVPKVRCVAPDPSVDFRPDAEYPVIPDAAAAEQGLIRVIDESGESYLYPAGAFENAPAPTIP